MMTFIVLGLLMFAAISAIIWLLGKISDIILFILLIIVSAGLWTEYIIMYIGLIKNYVL